MTPLVVPTACYNLKTVSSFFRIAARAVAIDLTTGVDWVTYKDSKVINALYKVCFWKEQPGNAVITQKGPAAIDDVTNEWHDRFLSHWVEKLAWHGPVDAMKYYNAVVSIRDMAIKDVEKTRREVIAINEAAIGETNKFIKELAAAKLAGELGVVAMGVVGDRIPGPVGWGLSAASTAGGVIFTTISNWESTDIARAVAIDPGYDRTAAGIALNAVADKVERRAEGMQGAALQRAEAAERIVRNARAGVERHAQELASRMKGQARIRGKNKRLATAMERGQEKVAAQTAVVNEARKAAQMAQATKDWVHAASRSLSFIFAAADVMDAIHEYDETVAEAQ